MQTGQVAGRRFAALLTALLVPLCCAPGAPAQDARDIRANEIQVVFRTGHGSSIVGVAMSADGRLIASQAWDQTLRIWDVASGEELRTLAGIDRDTQVTRFVGDTSRVVIGGSSSIEIIDSRTGQKLPAPYLAGEGQVAVSALGHFAAVRSRTPQALIGIVDLQAGREVASLRVDNYVTPLSVSDDGRTLLAQRIDLITDPKKIVKMIGEGKLPIPKTQTEIWDVPTGKHHSLPVVTSASGMSVLSSDGRLLAVADIDSTLTLYDAASGERRAQWPPDQSEQVANVNSVAFSADGRLVARASQRGGVSVWDIESGRQLSHFEGTSVNFSADGRTLVVGLVGGGAPLLRDLQSGRETPLEGGASAVVDLALVEDGRAVVAATEAGGARLWDLTTGQIVRAFQCAGGWPTQSVAVSARQPLLAVACRDGAVQLWNLRDGTLVRTLLAPTGQTNGVSAVVRFDVAGARLATAINDDVTIWDAATGDKVGHFTVPAGEALFSRETLGTALSGMSDAQREAIDRMVDDPKMAALQSAVVTMAFHPDGKRLAIGQQRVLSLWDVSTGERIREYTHESATSVSTDSDDSRVVPMTAPMSRKQLKEMQKRLAQQREAPGSRRPVPATGPFNGELHSDDWGDEDAEPLPGKLGDGATGVAFSADGRQLIALGVGGESVWDVESARAIVGAPPRPMRSSGDPTDTLIDDALSRGVAASPDGRFAARGRGKNVEVWDLQNGRHVAALAGHLSDVTSLTYAAGGRLLVSGGRDGAVRLWSLPDGRPVMQLIALGTSDYVAVTPDQFYRASKRRISGVSFRVGAQLYPFEQFDLRFNRPDVVLARLGRSSPDAVQAYRAAYERRLRRMGISESALTGDAHLPEVQIVATKVPVTTSATTLTLRVSAADTKYALDRINVFLNDVPVFGTAGLPIADREARSLAQDIQVPLVPGRNKIQVSVLNSQGVESLRQTAYTSSTASFAAPDVYLVAIGVSEYQNRAYNLRFAAKDAGDLMNAYRSVMERSGAHGAVHVLDLTNAKATRAGIRQAKEWLKQAKSNDLVVVFAAGHGMTDAQQNYYFGTYDIDPAHPETNGLPYEDFEGLLDGIASLQKVLLIDTCFSGEIDKDEATVVAQAQTGGAGTVSMRAFKAVRGVTVVGDTSAPQNNAGGEGGAQVNVEPLPADLLRFQQDLFADLRRGTGAVVISSASGNEYALEGDQWHNGVFTYALLSGLKNGKADKNADARVSVSELQSFVIEQVRELTAGGQNPTVRRENLDYDFTVF